MKYCRYHPLAPATYYCEYCDHHHCDSCIDEGEHGDDSRCFLCQRPCESLGASFNAEPFWRRFQDSFRYPLNTSTLVFIVAISLLNMIVAYLPLTFIWILMLTGVFMKYCFSCLERTANGTFYAPDISTAYEGGIALALKLIAIIFILIFSVVGTYMWLGSGFATLYGVLIVCASPAIIINFSLSESVLEAINPLKNLSLITAIGLPYGLLLAIIMVMLGSVGFIAELLSHSGSWLSTVVQSAIGNYYTIVLFHLMGYMLFQYQGKLGFIAREDKLEVSSGRPANERLLAHIDILVKEGLYDQVINTFQGAIKTHPSDKKLHERCMEFLIATKNIALIEDFTEIYFPFLVKNQANDQITLIYKRILSVHPQFTPKTAENRLLLAKECYQSGDSRSTVRLLNGLHKQYPQFPKLIEALELQASALYDLPNMTAKADQFAELVKRYKKQFESQQKKTKKPRHPPPSNNLSLEEQIANNADQYRPKVNQQPSNQQAPTNIDYDGGIDFK